MSNELARTASGVDADRDRDPDARVRDAGTDPDPDSDAVLELDGVGKSFGRESVIEEMDLSVRDGELLTLLGPSGCGKTTTLRLIAGLDRPDAGEIRLRGAPVAGPDASFVPPEERGVGVVFQEFALFPHLTAAENVAFGLQGVDEAERDRRVRELLELVGLPDKGEATPDELSGGQQQRVALARALAPKPQLLLLDEPFSNLDVDLRVEMREEVRRIIKEAGVTAVSVTHDQEEAMSISDRVAVLNGGRIDQVDPPERMFQHPESRFVAGFLGHASFLAGRVDGDRVETGLGAIPRERVHGLAPEYDDTDVDVLVRPDDVRARRAVADGRGESATGPGRGRADSEAGDGTVVYRRYLGPSVLYRVELDSGDTVACMHNHADEVGLEERVRVELTADHDLAWFPRGAKRVADGGREDASPPR